MRNPYLKKVLLGFALLLSISTLKAQSADEELVLQVPSVHADRNLSAMTTQLSSLGGVQYVAFCPAQQILILRIDRKIQVDDKNVLNVFTVQNYIVHIKTGVSAADIMSNCKDLLVPAPSNVPVNSSAE
jgi:hypothetical protein